MALNVRNKLGFIDGTIPKSPLNHRDYGSWSRCNDMVATWLMNSVSKKIGQSLLFMSTAESIWRNLLARFKQDDAPRVYEIEQRLNCTCGRCECNAALLWEKMQQRSRVTKFLMGLNEAYESTRRHILMLKPIPDIEDVFNMVTQDERQKTLKPSTRMENVAFQHSSSTEMSHTGSMESGFYNGLSENAAYAAAFQGNCYPQKPVCTHCSRTGHTVQKCYKLHGYPPGHKLHQKPSTPRGQTQSNQKPNFPSQSPLQHSHPATANAVSTTCPSLDLNQFTTDQVQSLLTQLIAQKRVNDKQPISQQPSGTITEHGFMASTSTAGVTVSLPNDTSISISHTRTVKISDTLVLHNVLHVDSFKFNLLSDHIQDLTIGKGLLMHGLYILEPISHSFSNSLCGSLVDGTL
ncbi:PREDICTED: uncharacterized protein LOC106314084 [Brassica oleracea var. oleracea]|uniref:uncharacterized protein LOC106314084 n=1 Tax=Brassica oleracea var. oleracea TaxID=109376 RepID=UPI0006A73F4E|nr:PREDICTED: uncharacterized protein LOC106314084 [Brassica oleracea var. oleracea]